MGGAVNFTHRQKRYATLTGVQVVFQICGHRKRDTKGEKETTYETPFSGKANDPVPHDDGIYWP